MRALEGPHCREALARPCLWGRAPGARGSGRASKAEMQLTRSLKRSSRHTNSLTAHETETRESPKGDSTVLMLNKGRPQCPACKTNIRQAKRKTRSILRGNVQRNRPGNEMGIVITIEEMKKLQMQV